MTIEDITPNEYGEFFSRYIQKVDEKLPLREGLYLGKEATISFFQAIPNEKQSYAYETGKWTVKEVLQHLIDTERVFNYRAFRIGRRDSTPLVGFEQDDYIAPSLANQKSMETLLSEYISVRDNTISMFQSLSVEDLMFIGNANNSPMSARAALFIILGHEIWHKEIVEQRYL